MGRSFVLAIPLLLILPALALGYDVLVVQDQRSPTYDTILKGFHANSSFKERLVVLQDSAENDLVRIVREDRPTLVLAVGGRAMQEARRLRQTPVVSVFSYSLQSSGLPASLVRIRMLPSIHRYAAIFQALGVKRVGTMLSATSAEYAAEAAEALRQLGIKLIVKATERPEEVTRQLEVMKGQIDAIWLLPDPAIINNSSVELVANFSIQQQLPLVSFSEAHLRRGAIAAFAVEPMTLGSQAADVAKRVIAGEEPNGPENGFPRKALLRFNERIMERYRISPEPLLRLGATRSGQ